MHASLGSACSCPSALSCTQLYKLPLREVCQDQSALQTLKADLHPFLDRSVNATACQINVFQLICLARSEEMKKFRVLQLTAKLHSNHLKTNCPVWSLSQWCGQSSTKKFKEEALHKNQADETGWRLRRIQYGGWVVLPTDRTFSPELLAWPESLQKIEEEALQKNQADESCWGGHTVKWTQLEESDSESSLDLFIPSQLMIS